MAFKMKGYQAHSKSPMKIKGMWSNIKKKAGEARDYIKDKTVNMSNVVGMSKEEKAQRDMINRQKKHRGRMDQAADDRKEHYGLMDEYKKSNPKQDNDKQKKAQAYADAKLKENKASRAKKKSDDLASMSPKTEAESKKKKTIPLAKKKHKKY